MEVLIADDDLTSRTMLKAVLSKWGYEVTSTCDGEEAYAALQQNRNLQLAILDWMMPGMDGATLLRKLRAEDRAEPLFTILLTSKSDRRDVIEGFAAGADDYVSKPWDNEELRARVNAGRRILELQDKLKQREKLQGVVEMAGAVCHELNQPVQVVLGFSELLLRDLAADDPRHDMLENIKTASERIGALTGKIMRITQYRTKEYLAGGSRIIDIDAASKAAANSGHTPKKEELGRCPGGQQAGKD
jgi:CheY-like chemotaxis protein